MYLSTNLSLTERCLHHGRIHALSAALGGNKLKRYLALSFVMHLLIIGTVLVASFRAINSTQPQSEQYIEFDVTSDVEMDTPAPKEDFWSKTGKSVRELFSVKSAYEVFKDKENGHTGNPTHLSDVEEIERELADDEARPAHQKKDVLFKSYVDMMGESAVLPWFSEVEKIVRLRKVFFDRTFETTVIVIINAEGQVVRVVTAKTSGDPMLDVAVKQAFLGQAYPRPPKDLIDTDGFGRVKWVFEMYLNLDLRKKGKFRISRRD